MIKFDKEDDYDYSIDPIKLVYDERRAANVDRDEEIAILRACGYAVPEFDAELNDMAVKMLDFMDKLNDRDRNLIKANAETVATRRKMIKQAGYRMEDFTTCDMQTPMELLNSTSKRKADIFRTMNLFKEADKQSIMESIILGFEIQNSIIDKIEDIIIEAGYKKY